MESNLSKTKVKKRANLVPMFQDGKGMADVLDPMHSKIVHGLLIHALHVGRLVIEFMNVRTRC